jgi:hypothetical protein
MSAVGIIKRGGLYQRLTWQIGAQPEMGTGGLFRNAFAESELLQQIASEIHYRPPSRKGLPARLAELERREMVEPESRAREAKAREARRKELTAELAAVEAELAPYSHSLSANLDIVSGLLGRRAAVDYLLSFIPDDEPLEGGAHSSALAARAAEIERARGWADRLEAERERIKRDVGGMEARGDESVLSNGAHYPRLWIDLRDVLRALADARENLKLVGVTWWKK